MINSLKILTEIIPGAMCGGIAFCTVAIIKNNVTFHWHNKILQAIFRYQRDVLDKAYFEATERFKNGDFTEVEVHFEVEIADMEDYNATFKRWYDWGYKHIIPKDKFEIIKPYMKQEREQDE